MLRPGAVRRFWTFVHRWSGLATALFLVVAGTTGAILPFRADLQRLAAPAPPAIGPVPAGAVPLAPPALLRLAEKRTGGLVETMPLGDPRAGAVVFEVTPRQDGPKSADNSIRLDPYSGRILPADHAAEETAMAQLLDVVLLVHTSLALGEWGTWLLGVTGLIWTVDCFVGFYLTLPLRRRVAGDLSPPAPWLSRWRPAWTIRRKARGHKLHFDLHRAISLWLWPLFFLFAWSSVQFNLNAVYVSVTAALVGPSHADPRPKNAAKGPPALDWTAALATGRATARVVAAQRGFTIECEREMRFDPDDHLYSYAVRSSRDRSVEGANTWFYIDGDSGRLLGLYLPTGDNAFDTVGFWLSNLHTAAVWGLPYRIAVSLVGLCLVTVVVTGVLIWLRKRTARSVRARRRGRLPGRRTPVETA